VQHDLLHGQYRFQPLRRIYAHGEFVELWAALDAPARPRRSTAHLLRSKA
jgi:hypothetical protein